MKLNSTGSQILYATYLGGGSDDSANAIAVDALGNAYVAGSTASIAFPVTEGRAPLPSMHKAMPIFPAIHYLVISR